MSETILRVNDLRLSFATYGGLVQAIRGVSFDLKRGETLAIVGESGSGKSVSTRAIIGLLSNNAIIEGGEICYHDQNLLAMNDHEIRNVRGSQIAMIFQDPMTSLNPTLTIGEQIMEVLRKKRGFSRKMAQEEAIHLLERVGIKKAAERLNQYPHQFSGGQRQRVVIAIALAGEPEVLIADEPTTALDVAIQAQIIELLKEIQEERGMSIIFITHDLGVVANVADRVAVMYAGKIVEYGCKDDIYYNPQHPYTWGLLSAMPSLESTERLYSIPGSPPDLLDPPKGDAFALRSEYALDIDYIKEPPMFQVSKEHYAATWLLHPEAPDMELPQAIQERHAHYRAKVAADMEAGCQ